MNAYLNQMFSDASGRYLDRDEVAKLNEFARSLPVRMKAMQMVEQAEEAILEDTINEVFRKHPDFASKHMHARDKCRRDVGYVLRYCAMAMVRNDIDGLKERLLFWLQTILHSFEFKDTIDTTYRTLLVSCERHLPEKYFDLIAPYLRLTHRILSQEPSDA